MTKQELLELIKDCPDNTEIGINSIYNREVNTFNASKVSECHYDEEQNKIILTPVTIGL